MASKLLQERYLEMRVLSMIRERRALRIAEDYEFKKEAYEISKATSQK